MSEDFPRLWIRAIMPTAILATLQHGPLHGYAIGQALGQMGFGTPKGGSLYPALGKLEESGFIAAEWVEGENGPGRKDYTLTSEGSDELARNYDLFRTLGQNVFAEQDRVPQHKEETR